MLQTIVLHHGLMGHGNLRWGPFELSYFRRIDRAISALGHPLVITQVHPTSSVEFRARQLKEQILRQLKSNPKSNDGLIIMAHSMGGLDARFAVTHLGLDRYVAAVVTVSTPHRGSPFADWVVEHLGRRLGANQLINFLKLDMRAAMDLTTTRCNEFNRNVPDMADVKYFSVSAAQPWTKMPPFALPSYQVISKAEGENDGLVSVKSAQWGTHLATWQADHWHTINRRWLPKMADHTGDIAPLWIDLLTKVKAQNS